MSSSPRRNLARLLLERVPAPRTEGGASWPAVELPWSRGLWGSFLPNRRVRDDGPPQGRERRR